jgi:hypothetical protein
MRLKSSIRSSSDAIARPSRGAGGRAATGWLVGSSSTARLIDTPWGASGDAGLHGFFECAINEVLVFDFDWRKQPRQGGAGLHCLGYRDMVPAWLAEGRGLPAVKVGGDQCQARAQLTKFIGSSRGENSRASCTSICALEKTPVGRASPRASSAVSQDFPPTVARHKAAAATPGKAILRRRNSP